MSLQSDVEHLFDNKPDSYSEADRALFEQFIQLLNRGEIRSAEPDSSQPTGWRVNPWVKKGILLGFRIGGIVDMSGQGALVFTDKSTYPIKRFTPVMVFASSLVDPVCGTARIWERV